MKITTTSATLIAAMASPATTLKPPSGTWAVVERQPKQDKEREPDEAVSSPNRVNTAVS